MKRALAIFTISFLLFAFVLPVSAAGGQVTYSGNAGNFIFEPGSTYSATDLLPDFKDVMPGDSRTDQVTVRNNADNKVKVDIYMRALGAQSGSEDFLSKLHLKVKIASDSVMPYMFDAAASETDGLTDWVKLGTLYSGGEVKLDVTLEVPVTLDASYMNQVGYFDWEFKVEEFPVESTDPVPTGDQSHMGLWIGLAAGSLAVLVFFIFLWKRKERKDTENEGKG